LPSKEAGRPFAAQRLSISKMAGKMTVARLSVSEAKTNPPQIVAANAHLVAGLEPEAGIEAWQFIRLAAICKTRITLVTSRCFQTSALGS
jgi:hypothetical protein